MFKFSWRRFPGLATSALALLFALPAVSEAQLFPNLATHKRPKPTCAEEAPVFHQYRQMYYGYYPTCWCRFAPGWGCPNPESPTMESQRVMAELERQIQAEGPPRTNEEPQNPDQGPMAPAQPDNTLPALPPERSPFNLDQNRPGAGGRQPAPAGPAGERNLDEVAPLGRPAVPGTNPPTVPPADRPENGASAPMPAGQPVAILDLKDPTARPSDGERETLPSAEPPSPTLGGNYAAAPPAPAANMPPQIVQAPQRRGPISTLFERWNMRRR